MAETDSSNRPQVGSPKHVVNWALIIFLIVYCAMVTVVYLINKNPIFHEVESQTGLPDFSC
jgi:hypothetical protein